MKKLLLLFSLFTFFQLQAQEASQYIRLNQIGFLPLTQKIAAIVDSKANQFEILDSNKKVVFSDSLSKPIEWSQSGEKVQIADFSTFTTVGTYTLRVKNYGESYPFEISPTVFTNVNNAIVKAFYFNRTSIEILPEFGGKYARPLGHADSVAIILPSAAGPVRKAGDVISATKGWYDAGDYNKYIVNSGVTVGTMLLAYENYKSYFDTLTWNIPESKNSTADLLDEIRWNLDWMLTMQDPDDGGVYNKTTEEKFCGMIMPDKAPQTRYVVAKGTAASLDFAAVMALSYRIYKTLDPAFAEKCLQASILAWNWAIAHPDIPFKNPEAEQGYPKITTGGYGDKTFTDEKIWAASELLIATNDSKYAQFIDLSINFSVPVWYNVAGMSLYSLYNHRNEMAKFINVQLVTDKIMEKATALQQYQQYENPYKVASVDYSWGSNGVLANQAILLLYAFNITNQINYFNAALASFDYILGRNATQYSFITEYGEKCTKNLHHRPSEGDNVEGSIPGFMAGGPNGSFKRDCFGDYSQFPAKAYYDGNCSYTTNEIAINWQAPISYLAHAIVAEYNMKIANANKTYAISLQNNITCNRTDVKNSISIISNTEWKLETKDTWYKIVNSKGDKNATITIEILQQNNTENTRTGSFLLLVNNAIVQTITISQKGKQKNFRLEAENFTHMYGVQTEQTTDNGGGLNVGWINNNDTLVYSIDIPFTGTYKIDYRIASESNFGDFYMESQDSIYSRIDFTPTGGWQTWATISDTAYFTEGIHTVYLQIPVGGFNLNYMDFSFLGKENSAPVHKQK
jgi:endoglucanase